jgi:hypothetical protein
LAPRAGSPLTRTYMEEVELRLGFTP